MNLNFRINLDDTKYDKQYFLHIYDFLIENVNIYSEAECRQQIVNNHIILLHDNDIESLVDSHKLFDEYVDKKVYGLTIFNTDYNTNSVVLCSNCDIPVDEIFVHELTHIVANRCDSLLDEEYIVKFYDKIYQQYK
jgi:hypothetical protein